MNKSVGTRLWKDFEIAESLSAKKIIPVDTGWYANGISIDSRTLKNGELFVAIKGEKFDGHDFVKSAFDCGAIAVIVDRESNKITKNKPVFFVNDAMEALRELAKKARDRSGAEVVTITGSVGKTGTKNLLAASLKSEGLTVATKGNLNNHIGLPLSLARMPKVADYGIFEVGMSAPGEIAPLSLLARPHIAIITSVEATHIEFFKNLKQIADAKAEVFNGLVAGGVAVINQDSKYFEYLSKIAKSKGASEVVGFGDGYSSTAKLLNYEHKRDHSLIEASIHGVRVKYKMKLLGRHWAVNSLSVLATINVLGANLKRAAEAMQTIEPASGRGNWLHVPVGAGKFLLIDESYNASPASVIAALTMLKAIEPASGGERIVILGDMLELGTRAKKFHLGLSGDLMSEKIGRVFLAGPLMKVLANRLVKEKKPIDWCQTSASLAQIATSAVKAGDIVMVKGSRGSQMQIIVKALARSLNR